MRVGYARALVPGCPTNLESGPSPRKATAFPFSSRVRPWYGQLSVPAKMHLPCRERGVAVRAPTFECDHVALLPAEEDDLLAEELASDWLLVRDLPGVNGRVPVLGQPEGRDAVPEAESGSLLVRVLRGRRRGPRGLAVLRLLDTAQLFLVDAHGCFSPSPARRRMPLIQTPAQTRHRYSRYGIEHSVAATPRSRRPVAQLRSRRSPRATASTRCGGHRPGPVPGWPEHRCGSASRGPSRSAPRCPQRSTGPLHRRPTPARSRRPPRK